MAFSPLQKSFNAGEISEKLRGQFGSSIYEKGLDTCENLIPTPQGSLLMRAGGQDIADLAVAAKPRFIPFRVAGAADDFIIALTDGKMEVFSRATGVRAGIRIPIFASHFDADLDGWTTDVGFPYAATWENESVRIDAGEAFWRAGIAFTVGYTYKVKVRFKSTLTTAGELWISAFNPAGGATDFEMFADASPRLSTAEFEFTATRTDHTIRFRNQGGTGTPTIFVDWVVIYTTGIHGGGLAQSIVAPWSEAQLPAVQFDSEPVKNRMSLVHPEVPPQVISVIDDIWEVRTAKFVSPPGEWGDGNWPSAVETGFQGRQYFGATPNEPHTIWYSKSGALFNFTTGANAADASSFIVSTKGEIKWLKGQKRLFAGAETIEHSISGSNRIITPTDIQVDDQSAFGSGAVQGIHIGDQVLWVTRSLRSVRAMNYEQKEDSWISTALTFICEGLLPASGIREIHFCRDPFPSLFIVSNDDRLFAATYDRSVQVIAFYRVTVAAGIATAAVADGPKGSELWYSPLRGGSYRVERIPMHEDGVDYLDSWSQVVADGGGVMVGLDRFNGQTITVKYLDDEGNTLVATADVAGGSATVEDAAGQTVAVGLSFTARAVTLPLALKDKKGRYSRIGVLLNRSALPKLNGWIPQNDKLEDDPQGLPQTLRSGKFSASNEGTDDEAKITIEQSLPFRTEILALYGTAEG